MSEAGGADKPGNGDVRKAAILKTTDCGHLAFSDFMLSAEYV